MDKYLIKTSATVKADDDKGTKQKTDKISSTSSSKKYENDDKGTKRKTDEISSTSSSKKYETKRVRTFQSAWTKEFPWLKFDNEKQSMFCSVCHDHPSVADTTADEPHRPPTPNLPDLHDMSEPDSQSDRIDFKIKTVELGGKKIKLQIWDTAGQERFHTITTSYYRGAMGIMLVYDITNTKSFENISKWLRNIDEHANEDVEKMILGNKCDMENKRQVSKDRGESIAKEHSIPFLETSAKANINVEKAFMDLANAILLKTPGRDSEPKGETLTGGSKQEKRNCCST